MSEYCPSLRELYQESFSRSVFFRFPACVFILLLCSLVALADARDTMQTQSFSGKKRYVHPCPEGTEAVGNNPPEGRRIFCRQPVIGGYRRHGAYTKWYQNGQPRIEGEFYKDKRHGVWKYYHRNGQLKSTTRYLDDKVVEKLIYKSDGTSVSLAEKRKEREQRRQELSGKAEGWKKRTTVNKRHKRSSWVTSNRSNRKVKLFKNFRSH